MLDYNVTEESPDKKENARNPAVRFYAHIEPKDCIKLEPELLDRSFKNRLQDSNL